MVAKILAWIRARPWTILAVLVFGSVFLTYNLNKNRANEAHHLAQTVAMNEHETNRLARLIIKNGENRRTETCVAFFKLYRGKRQDLITQFRQINSRLTRQFFTVTPKQIAEVRQTYLPRYKHWRNIELPNYCPQRRKHTPPFPKRP